jgi:lipopolysaccharide transport system permease protein
VSKINTWTEIIDSKNSIFKIDVKAISENKDLLIMFVKRDFIATYKQTILGPLWFFIQPMLTTLMFTIVFGKFANLKTDIEPKFLFYLSGIVIWNFFQECFLKTSTVLKDNTQLFGKVFFPRLLMPLSIIISSFIKFLVQFFLFIFLVIFYSSKNGSAVHSNLTVFLIPFIILLMACFAFGAGLIIASLTTKYRDLSFVVSFGVQLLMYASPIIYSTSTIPNKYKNFVLFNPLSGIIESFRNAFLGAASINYPSLFYSTLVTILLVFIGVIFFNKVEKRFIDTA